jgi:hypothetical protein
MVPADRVFGQSRRMTCRCRLFGRRATAVVPSNRVAAEASLSPFNPHYPLRGHARDLAAQIILIMCGAGGT